MTTHAQRWLTTFADALDSLAANRGRIDVLLKSQSTTSSNTLGLSARDARAVASLVQRKVKGDQSRQPGGIDIVDSIPQQTAVNRVSTIAMTAASLMAAIREKFGDDKLPEELEHHLDAFSEDALSKIAERVPAAVSLPDLLGSHHPAPKPLPSTLRPVDEAPRDGTEVWLLIPAQAEFPVDEFIVAGWQEAHGRWMGQTSDWLFRLFDSSVRGWLPLDAPLQDPAAHEAIRTRWHGSVAELRRYFGEAA